MSVGLLRYRKKVAQYDERVGELNIVTQERDDLKKQYDDWRKRRQVLFLFLLFCLRWLMFPKFILCSGCDFRLDEFMEGFNTISLKLKEMYQVILYASIRYFHIIFSLENLITLPCEHNILTCWVGGA